MLNYDYMLKLANEHSFSSFTELQELAFREQDSYDYGKDLFVIGETSSGKTLIPLLLYAAAVKEAKGAGEECPKMLFVVPYRALAAQKTLELQRFFKNDDLKIVQSTGEFRQDDDLIQNADIDIAVVITEKVYKYEARDSAFLSQYDYIVLDEIGLISNADRGIRLDFIFAWAKNQKLRDGKPRIIALGTPFFDWSAYIDSYQFTPIKLNRRPVKLNEVNVFYNNTNVERVEGKCTFIRRGRQISEKEIASLKAKYAVPGSACQHLGGEICDFTTPCRQSPDAICPVSGKPCPDQVEFVKGAKKKPFRRILIDICREHVMAGQQVLVFVNDRMKVVEYSKLIYEELKDCLPPAPPAKECKRKLLEECKLESDDVFGIMENDSEHSDQSGQDELYQAFISGIAFHSAALPNELRSYVEMHLLESRDMHVVCSTETLAFGVNSSVDVVIIADLNKHEGSTVRPLSLNEFQNYSGRAGRLRIGTDFSSISGSVYTLISKNQVELWNKMNMGRSAPDKMYSLFHRDEGQFMPFFLLNLLPTTSDSSITIQELMDTVQLLPRDGTVADELLEQRIQAAIEYLKIKGLAAQVKSRPQRGEIRGARSGGKKYCLTELGKRLRGYVIGCDDYETLLRAITTGYVHGIFIEPDKARFLYNFLCTHHAESGLNSIFSDSDTRISIDQARSYVKQHMPPEADTHWVDTCYNTRVLFILAALLAWCDGESPKHLYREFGIHYALLSKLAEQIGYLVEISREIMPSQLESIYLEKEQMYSRLNITHEDYTNAVLRELERMRDLFVSIYFGVNTRIIKEISDFLKDREDLKPSDAQLEELSLQHLNPRSARTLRKIVIRYKFFENPPEVDMTNIEMKNNFLDQYRQYKRDVEHFGAHILAFFRHKFPSDFNK